MARIFPFRALRYDPARVRLSEVVTQPYDKITPEMQERYYAASPYNLVRIILGRSSGGEHAGGDVYTRAAESFAEWRRAGIFLQDHEPSIYRYAQSFSLTEESESRRRQGFIALGRLEDYSAGIVFRHEHTLAKPKADRLQLLRSTRAHFGQIFMLYSDPKREIDSLLGDGRTPEVDVADEYGVRHLLWRVSDPVVIQRVRSLMSDKKLIIADGHHRYETALNYRNERRAEAAAAREEEDGAVAPYDAVMMTFVNMDGEGLEILPTHRVVHGLARFDAEDFLGKANAYFEVDQVFGALDGRRAMQLLREAGAMDTALLAVTAVGAFMLRARPGLAVASLPGFSARQQQLDVVRLHKIVLEQVLGITEEAIRDQSHLRYVRDADEAIAAPEAGADVGFLMNPVRMSQVRDIAFHSEVLPQKSTDFYPKLLSGLTIYALE